MGEENAKRETLGFIPNEKLAATVGAKVWESHKKNLAALAAARDATATTKADVIAAIVKKLNLPDPGTVDIGVHDDRVVIYRRAKERKARGSTMPDLTAAS